MRRSRSCACGRRPGRRPSRRRSSRRRLPSWRRRRATLAAGAFSGENEDPARSTETGEGERRGMNVPEDLKYTKEHEWVRVDGDRVIVGITDFAQDALGDVV